MPGVCSIDPAIHETEAIGGRHQSGPELHLVFELTEILVVDLDPILGDAAEVFRPGVAHLLAEVEKVDVH
jgi:hypothetical protein